MYTHRERFPIPHPVMHALYEYYDRPSDSYEVRIEHVWPLKDRYQLLFKRAANRDNGMGGHSSIRHGYPLFFGSWDGLPAGDLELEQDILVNDVLRDYQFQGDVETAAEDIPVLLLPYPVTWLIKNNKCTFILLLLCRWHGLIHQSGISRRQERFPGPITGWPPCDSPAWEAIDDNMKICSTDDVHEFDVDALDSMADGLTYIARSLKNSGHMDRLEKIMASLRGWGAALRGDDQVARKHRHSSEKVVESIKLMRCLKGGAGALADILVKSIALTVPEVFRPAFIEGCRRPSHNPASSMLQHYELSFDAAITMLQIDRTINPKIRFDWNDSSPQAGYDWLWSEYRQIAKRDIPQAFNASVRLSEAVAQRVAVLEEEARHRDEEGKIELDVAPVPEWADWLNTLSSCFDEYINMPAALASGHKALAHKCGTKAWNWALVTPKGQNVVNEYSNTYASSASDMGTELGLPYFNVDGGAQALLPTWFDKTMARDDLDIHQSSPDVVPATPTPAGDSDGNCDVDGPMGSASPAASSCHIPGSDEESDGVKGDASSVVSIASANSAALDADQEDLDSGCWLPYGPDAAKPSRLMPCALPIAGLQHICDNTNKDTHESLSFWDEYHAGLK